jgi:hypothetical protein
MLYYFHIWLNLSLALVFWAKVYITFQRHRQDPTERKWDLVINSIFALLFTFALLDLITTLPKIIELLNQISGLVGK